MHNPRPIRNHRNSGSQIPRIVQKKNKTKIPFFMQRRLVPQTRNMNRAFSVPQMVTSGTQTFYPKAKQMIESIDIFDNENAFREENPYGLSTLLLKDQLDSKLEHMPKTRNKKMTQNIY